MALVVGSQELLGFLFSMILSGGVLVITILGRDQSMVAMGGSLEAENAIATVCVIEKRLRSREIGCAVRRLDHRSGRVHLNRQTPVVM
jgi:hypothetical protein